jgi:hypothetical protein
MDLVCLNGAIQDKDEVLGSLGGRMEILTDVVEHLRGTIGKLGGQIERVTGRIWRRGGKNRLMAGTRRQGSRMRKAEGGGGWRE